MCLIASEPVTSAATDWVSGHVCSPLAGTAAGQGCGPGAGVCLFSMPDLTPTSVCPNCCSAQVEVPSNTAVVVCREKGGILNILLSPLIASGAHASQEEVARCLEAVNHAASFGNEAKAAPGAAQHSQHSQHHHCHHGHHLLHSRSMPNMPNMPSRQGSLPGLAAAQPADSLTDSGTTQHHVPSSPGFGGGPGGALSFGRLASIDERCGQRGGAAVSVGEDDQLTGHTASVMCLTVANGLLFSGSTDATIKVRACGGPHLPAMSAGADPLNTQASDALLSRRPDALFDCSTPCFFHCCSTSAACCPAAACRCGHWPPPSVWRR